jgi:hypothetical protein
VMMPGPRRARFTATALKGDKTIEISKLALLDVLGKGAGIELHEVCTKCKPSRTQLVATNARARICGS